MRCGFAWSDGWGDHTCIREPDHLGNHRCRCDIERRQGDDMNETNAKRIEALTEMVGTADFATLNDQEGLCFPDDESVPRFLLMEHAPKYGRVWHTLHKTPEDAANYHDGQEYVEDWGVYKLFDLDNGDEFVPEIKTTWAKFDRAGA